VFFHKKRNDDEFPLDVGIDSLVCNMNIGNKSENVWQTIIRHDLFIDFMPYQEGGAKLASWSVQ